MEKSFDPDLTWQNLDPKVAHSAIAAFAESRGLAPGGLVLQGARCAELKAFARHRLIELEVLCGERKARLYALNEADEFLWLDGSPIPIFAATRRESLSLTSKRVLAFLRFFMFAIRSEDRAFVLIESADDYRTTSAFTDDLAKLQKLARPLVLRDPESEGPWHVNGTVAYEDAVFAVTLEVKPNGEVQMTDDECVVSSALGIELPTYPSLDFGQLGLQTGTADLSSSTAEGGPAAVTTAAGGGSGEEPVRTPAASANVQGGATNQARISAAFVEVLLTDALSDLSGHSLYRRFNERAVASTPIDRFAEFLFTSWPVVLIEGGPPFVESVVADTVRKRHSQGVRAPIARAGFTDASTCHVDPDVKDMSIVLIPMHIYDKLLEADRVAHELSMRNVAVLIGCERAANVPEPLRRVADMSLQLPAMDARRFRAVFEKILQVPCPALSTDTNWVRYVVPSDFQQVLQLNLTPADAVSYVKERVQGRLTAVDPAMGPALKDLHGMGDARQIAEDLIEDIRDARKGRISWESVDRGMLLVGQPGTGKTTLARAIAKECGVKFINASAARWQASGFLDSHLRAIRADFAAARRYSPAILFIDEIDSIGNRELLSGSNAVYQTDVINALLEEMSGFDSSSPIVVIGATNFPERVDPALRRAGRLDRTVTIPYPSIQSLVAIFKFYLKPYLDSGALAQDIDFKVLSELSFGYTGADVDLFVRGAARRARKAARAIMQRDLIDEITGKPRGSEGVIPLSPEDILGVAVHEAGHALAILLSSKRAQYLSFASIIPRHDGTLGYVASVPDGAASFTRRQLMERLEITLAGRAAEEVAFGKNRVSDGSGGSSHASDLAVATGLVRKLVTQYGFGPNGHLRWSEGVLPQQEHQIERILQQGYRSIVAKLKAARPVLDRIAAEFIAQQELTGTQLRALFEEEMPKLAKPDASRMSRRPSKSRRTDSEGAKRALAD
jgi:ATP-dependent Zn protease